MHPKPICVPRGILAAKALHVMEEFSINQLIVTDADSRPVGMVHLHDLLKAGLA
jgi:arabinose-5-phosphate isomerase